MSSFIHLSDLIFLHRRTSTDALLGRCKNLFMMLPVKSPQNKLIHNIVGLSNMRLEIPQTKYFAFN